MASSFFALLDDIAVLAKATAASIDDVSVLAKAAASATDDIVAGASKAASKTAAVVIDDAAVAPQYLQGISPSRELPIVWRIARGSLVNKAAIILAIMLLSILAPWIFPWALIFGGGYLTFEGAEKLLHYLQKKRAKSLQEATDEAVSRKPRDENSIVRSAITTDLVLSTEIMLISMNNLGDNVWWTELAMLVIVGLMMTGIVYGAVGLLIKLDDVGVAITKRGVNHKSVFEQKLGTALVRLMPVVFRALSIIGTAAMLWVGGHLLLANSAEVGLTAPLELVHSLTHGITGGFLLWLVDALISAICGIAAGLVIVAAERIITPIFKKRAKPVE